MQENNQDKLIKTENEFMANGFVTVAAAAQFLSVGRSTIYKLMENGQLEYAKILGSRRIPKRALVELASANLRGGWTSAS